ncbi:hypothetical protein [Streptacidiphilus cavernicola]|uniref:Rieske domain-containing protein n=1 Tax=Streptacidiphilus cavernicola TaxID=3342716 RepID=A0ABV6VYY5_9ACTN
MSDNPDPLRCQVTWGVCPEHGATLRAVADGSVCAAPGCPRTWDYDRFAAPCPDLATHQVADSAGGMLLLCGGHALAVGGRLEGAVITPLGAGRG